MTLFITKKLNIVLLFLILHNLAYAGEVPSITANKELISRRDRNTKHYLNSNGTINMITSAGSLHYLNENQQWTDINTNIQLTQGPAAEGFAYQNTENSFMSFYPSFLSGNGTMTLLNKHKIIEARKSGYYFESTAGKTQKYKFQTEAGAVNNNSIIYHSKGTKTDIRYTILADQRKLDWILNDRTLIEQAPKGSKLLVIYESIELPDGWQIKAEEGRINVYDEKGTWLVQYEKPFIHETSFPTGNRAEDDYCIFGDYRLISINSEWFIETIIDLNWLKSDKRVYPLVIDPTASYYPNSTTYWTGYQTSASGKSNGYMRVTSGLNVGWAKFNISSLPSAAIVNQTVMNSYHYQTTGTKVTRVNDMNATDPVSASASAISSAIAANDAYISNYPYGAATYGWRSAVLGSAANSDIMARRSQGWTAMGFNYVSGSTTFMYHYGWNGANPPYLSITYLDAIVDAGVSALVNPSDNDCGKTAMNIIVRVKNYSSVDSVSNLAIVCNISGSINTTITGILNRKLYAGTEDTIILSPPFNTLMGANLQFSIYTDYGNDPDHSNDTLTLTRTINPVPNMIVISNHSSSLGTIRAGTLTEPDHSKAGDSIVYELQPPSGFTSSQFGSAWDISQIDIQTSGLTSFGTFYQGTASSGNRLLILKPQSTETDSLYRIDITYRIINTGCDSVKTRWFYVAPTPVVNFDADSVCFGHSATFSNTTSLLHELPSYHWDFGTTGNGDTSDQINPYYLYPSPGNYTVTLTATSSLGYSVTLAKAITVLNKPFALFSFKNACLGEDVILTNLSTIGGSQTNLSYLWDLGDSSSAVSTNVSWNYTSNNLYHVKLKAYSQFGCSDSFMRQITVYDRPVAAFAVSNLCTGQNTEFINNTTISAGRIGYFWDFSDSTFSIQKSPLKSFAQPDSFMVKLVAFSDFGCTDTVILPVLIHPTPLASFTAASFCSRDSVTFMNTSSLPGGGTLLYEWDLGNGNISTSPSSSFSEFYPPGSYTIKLKAKSTDNCQAEQINTIVVYPNPHTSFYTGFPLCEQNNITFTNASSLQTGTMSYQWSFETAGSSSQQNPVVSFTTPGTKTIKLISTSDQNCTDSISKTIEIKPAPNADFDLTVINPQKHSILLQPIVTDHYTYEWSMGDGGVSNQISPVYSYLQNGIYQVTLTVTDINQCVNSSDTSVMFNVGTFGLESQTGLLVYPVPANEFMNLTLLNKQQGSCNYQLIDVSGKVIVSGDFFNDVKVETSTIPAGIYLLRVSSATDILNTQKIIISH